MLWIDIIITLLISVIVFGVFFALLGGRSFVALIMAVLTGYFSWGFVQEEFNPRYEA